MGQLFEEAENYGLLKQGGLCKQDCLTKQIRGCRPFPLRTADTTFHPHKSGNWE